MNRGNEEKYSSKTGMASSLPASGRVRKGLIKILALTGLAAAALLPLSVTAQAQSESGGSENLEAAVIEEMGVESNTSARNFAAVEEEGRTQVNTMRTGGDGNWAFGAAVIEAEKKKGHYPKGWLFVAEDAGEGWNVALEGSPEFSNLASEAPEEVVDGGEKKTFSSGAERTTSAASSRTGLMLPWRSRTTWRFTGGPHGWNTGYDRPYAALDFAGKNASDQRVRAAGGGQVYTMCGSRRGWVRVYHPNGFTTDYYHLIQNIKPAQGARIKVGTVLGLTGNDVSCGGASYGRHVHFALLRGAQYVPVSGRYIGGWRFAEGQAYGGYAQRKGVTRFPGSGVMNNFGPNG